MQYREEYADVTKINRNYSICHYSFSFIVIVVILLSISENKYGVSKYNIEGGEWVVNRLLPIFRLVNINHNLPKTNIP